MLFAIAFSARLAVNDPDALLANFYIVPIAVLAIEFGTRAGLIAAAVAFALVPAWSRDQRRCTSTRSATSLAGAAFLVTGVVVGGFSDRLRRDIAERQDAQRDLALYADQLEGSNRDLARSVGRLEAFAEIARAVGGETDLERILSLILDPRPGDRVRTDARDLPARRRRARGREREREAIRVAAAAAARRLAGRPGVPDRATRGASARTRTPRSSSSSRPTRPRRSSCRWCSGARRSASWPASTAPASEAFDDEDEQLLMSVAASAATAVATARSVAAARLRLSLEAADQARGRGGPASCTTRRCRG